MEAQARELPPQVEMFPTLIGGKRPRPRSRRKKKEEATQMIQQQLDLYLEILETPTDEPIRKWSIKEIELLHDFLLERSIQVLADARSSSSTVVEILGWVNANPQHPEQFGFSFRLCCLVCGYDEDRLRDNLNYESRRLHGIAA